MKKKLLLTLAIAGAVQAAEIQPAWLYQDISPEAYVRVPQQWTLLFANGARDPSPVQPHWQAIQEKLPLLRGDDKTLTPAQKTVIDDILTHNIGALEIAVYLGEGGAPQILLSAQFDYRDEARFLAFAQSIAELSQSEHQGNGAQGQIINREENLHIAYRFDQNSGKHWWLTSSTLPDSIDWAKFTGKPSESLLAATRQIDPQGLGFMVWVRNNPLALRAATDEHSQWAKALQVFKIKSLSAGYGIGADDKPALQFNLETTAGGLRDFFPAAPTATDIAVHGTLESAIAFTLPDSAGMQKILRILEQGSGERSLYAQFKEDFEKETKLDIERLFNAVGTQWLVINDDFGQIYAIRKNDHWQPAIDMLRDAGYLTLNINEDSGLHHARLSFSQVLREQAQLKEDTPPLLRAILDAPTHFYYHEEGDYLIFADLPQPLMDRRRTKGGSSIGSYLGTAANGENTLLGTMKIDHLARRHYYSRLYWLQYLSDIAGVAIDMSTLPTATMLNLPDKGYLHAQIHSDADNLRLKFSFEHSALDIFQQQGIYNSMSTVAAMGILAAIAVPAYRDYLERVEMAEQEAQATQTPEEMSEADIAAIQALIEKIFTQSQAVRDKIDRGETVTGMDLAPLHRDIPEIDDITIENGIYITFDNTAYAYLQSAELILWPNEGEKGVWHCYLDDPYLLADTLLPVICSPYND